LNRRSAIGVTGTPCTGKKSVAPLLASLLGRELVDINSVARATLGRHHPKRANDPLLVDLPRLRTSLRDRGLRGALVSGHLLPDLLGKRDLGFVAVLRCEPLELRARLEARGYSHVKLVDNLEAELIGLVLDDSIRAFGAEKVHEYDTTGANPAAVAELIARDYRSGEPQARPWIDWTLSYYSADRLRLLLSPGETRGPATT